VKGETFAPVPNRGMITISIMLVTHYEFGGFSVDTKHRRPSV
jgi:hypothetical protein